MEEALSHISSDKILFMEDDEYYSPNYVEWMFKHLQNYEVVGIAHSKYYHLPSFTYYIHNNFNHASLAQTGIRYSYLNKLDAVLKGDSFLDIRLWSQVTGTTNLIADVPNNWNLKERILNERSYLFIDDESLYCGMKGMPGRMGIGSGHRASIGIRDNPSKDILRKWIPNNYNDYLQLMSYYKGV
jgi:hypothetical protein